MDPNRQPHQVSNENDPFGGARLIGHIFPLQNRPKHRRREEAGQGIHLPFNRTEPKGIAEGVGKGANDTRPNHTPLRTTFQFLVPNKSFGQVGDRPKEKKNGEGTAEHRQTIGRQRRRLGSHGDHEKARKQHEEWRARRVTHFKFVSGRNELPAIPKTCRGFDCQEIHHRGDEPNGPSCQVVEAIKTHAASSLREVAPLSGSRSAKLG